MSPPDNRHRSPADTQLGDRLLALARHAIARELDIPTPAPDMGSDTDGLPSALERPGATFVTLTRRGRLRGCIGSLEARRALGDDVAANARAAAFRDPRFPPLSREEWPEIRIEVSLIHPARPLPVASEEEAWDRLHPGQDGVILQDGGHCATFLPQVWDSLPNAQRFLAELKRKAGLPPDYWSADLHLSTYRVDKWQEKWPEGEPLPDPLQE